MGAWSRRRGTTFDHVSDQLSTSRLQDEFSDTVARKGGRIKIRAAFETMRGVGVQPVPAGHRANNGRVPPRRFDQDVSGLASDHRVEAAHDAGESDRLEGVGDDEILTCEFALNAVEGLKSFAVAGAADDQFAAFEQVEIEDVRGFAHLPECVISGIDGVVDGTLVEEL